MPDTTPIDIISYLLTTEQLRSEIGSPTDLTSEIGGIADSKFDALILRHRNTVELKSHAITSSDQPDVIEVNDKRGIFDDHVLSVDATRFEIGQISDNFVSDGQIQTIINRKVKELLDKRATIPHFIGGGTIVFPIEGPDAKFLKGIIAEPQLRREIGSPTTSTIAAIELTNIIYRNVKERLEDRVYLPDFINDEKDDVAETTTHAYGDKLIDDDQLRQEIGGPNSYRITDKELNNIINRCASDLLDERDFDLGDAKCPDDTTDERGDWTDYIIDEAALRARIGEPSTARVCTETLQNIINLALGACDIDAMFEKSAIELISTGELELNIHAEEINYKVFETSHHNVKKFEVSDKYYPFPTRMLTEDNVSFTLATNIYSDDKFSPYPRRRYEVKGQTVYCVYENGETVTAWVIPRTDLREYVISNDPRFKDIISEINTRIMAQAFNALAARIKLEDELAELFVTVNAVIIVKAKDLLTAKVQWHTQYDAIIETTNAQIIQEASQLLGRTVDLENKFNEALRTVNLEILAESRAAVTVRMADSESMIALIEATNQTILAEARNMLESSIVEGTRLRTADEV